MVQYIQLEMQCQDKKAEIKINGRRIKSYSDYEEVLKTIDKKTLATLNNQASLISGILCSL